MIIHISRERFESIIGKGYGRYDTPNNFSVPDNQIRDADDSEYHLLDGDVGPCEYCGGVAVESVPVDSFVDLEVVKSAMRVMDGIEGIPPMTTDDWKGLIEQNKAA